MEANDLMTTEETGVFIHTPTATLRYWRHIGTGPRSFKLGAKRVMYRRSDVEQWLQQQYDAEQVGA